MREQRAEESEQIKELWDRMDHLGEEKAEAKKVGDWDKVRMIEKELADLRSKIEQVQKG